jgi:deoxyadenosine/deoxycytidine kinase
MPDNRYIVVEGVIGVGKTSLVRLLTERLQARLVLEEVEENPFLKDFYRDRQRYAFQTQMHFLFSRYQQQRAMRQTELFTERTVSDYLFQKDRIFASLNLSDRELALYERLVAWLELDVMKPDVAVYLQANPDTLMARIARRGRPYERDMEREYIRQLNEAYNHFFFHYTATPLLVVETSQLDLTWGDETVDDLLKQIKGMGPGTRYYVPRTTP